MASFSCHKFDNGKVNTLRGLVGELLVKVVIVVNSSMCSLARPIHRVSVCQRSNPAWCGSFPALLITMLLNSTLAFTPAVTPASFTEHRIAGCLPRLIHNKPCSPVVLGAIKRFAEDEDVLKRQRVLTDAMNLLSNWDEEQTEFVTKYADPNAPLGDWRGLRRQLGEEERDEMRKACKVLCEDAAYVLIGLNADSEEEGLEAYHEWITALELPLPDEVPYLDDVSCLEFRSLDEMPEDFRDLMNGPVHLAYSSKAGADPVTGDDSQAPPKAHMMPYPAPDRGVVFTPILDGFFTQYGDVPLDLFSQDDFETRQRKNQLREEKIRARDPLLAARQHATLGNPEAGLYVNQNQNKRPGGA